MCGEYLQRFSILKTYDRVISTSMQSSEILIHDQIAYAHPGVEKLLPPSFFAGKLGMRVDHHLRIISHFDLTTPKETNQVERQALVRRQHD